MSSTLIAWQTDFFIRIASDWQHKRWLQRICILLPQWCQVILQKQESKFEKQVKNGNLTEKQAQNALAGKFNKSKNQQENQIYNQGGKSEKKPKMSKF